MLVQEETYFNFVNSINSEVTKKNLRVFLVKILKILQIGPGFFTKITNTGSIEPYHKISSFSRASPEVNSTR